MEELVGNIKISASCDNVNKILVIHFRESTSEIQSKIFGKIRFNIYGCSDYKSERSFVLDMNMCDEIGLNDQRMHNINSVTNSLNLYINYVLNFFKKYLLFTMETTINDKKYIIRTQDPYKLASYFSQTIKKLIL